MYATTSRRRRHSARAAAVATIAAVIFGAAACGTETASDNGKPGAAAPVPKVQTAPHLPMSADTAERLGVASERLAAQQVQQQYLRHLVSAAEQHNQLKLRRQRMHTPSGREIPIP